VTGVLESVDWGKPALSLLESLRGLEPDKSAVLHIRHTERPPYNPDTSNQLHCTIGGRKAAVEFGRGVSPERRVRLHSTKIKRAEETAQCIGEGLASRGIDPTYSERFDDLMILDPENATKYLSENLKRSRGEVEASINFTNNWCAGLTPPAFCDSRRFARFFADHTQASLEGAEPTGLDIYVTHDVWVGCLLWHWFGIPAPSDGIGFLDGFLLQPREDAMTLWFRGDKRIVGYPQWWGSTQTR
jgi:hypothetical protein